MACESYAGARIRMYRIPSDLNLSHLVGSEIDQIRHGRYDLQFCFRGAEKICVQADVELFEDKTLIARWNEENNWSTVAFQKLFNAKVLGWSVPNDRLLQINFEGDLVLCLHDNSDSYESMQIWPEGIII